MNKIRRLLAALYVFALLSTFTAMLSGEIILKSSDDKISLTNIYLLESPFQPGSFISGDLISSGFKPYISGLLPDSLKGIRKMYTFRSEFFINAGLSNTLISLNMGPCSYPYTVYLNGSVINMRGNYIGMYQSASYDTVSIQLRRDLLNFGGSPNEIAIQAFPLGDFSPLETPVMTTEKISSRMAFVRNLLNLYLIQASFVIGILIGLYFLLLFSARNFTNRHYLYFALMCFFFSFSYFNNSFTYSSVDEISLEKVSYFSFPMAALFVTLFVREYTNFLKKFWVFIVLILPTVVFSFYVLLLNTKSDIDAFFNNYSLNIVIMPMLLLSFILLISAFVKTRQKNYLLILFAFLLNIIASIHDMIYTLNYQQPYCWLLPYSYLCMLISIFIVLAMEESTIYSEAMKRTRELDRKNAAMRTVLGNLETVSRNLINSSTILKDNISKAASVISESGLNNIAIAGKLKIQLVDIEKVTVMIKNRLENTANSIPKAVLSQTSVVEETNRTVNGMNTHIDKILRSIIQTDNIAKELSGIADNSKEIVIKSRESIGKVFESTKFISEVLENIQEIVEESNFLSVNASIESSYAGDAGEGFSILASEIRNLANKSKERLDMSQERLKQMTVSISDSIKYSDQVASYLMNIIEKSVNSADMIVKMSALMNEHKIESNSILEGTGILLQETLSIRDMMEEDRTENEKLKTTLVTLKKSFVEITALLSSQEESQNNIMGAISHIQEVLSENLKTIDILKETIMIAGPEKI